MKTHAQLFLERTAGQVATMRRRAAAKFDRRGRCLRAGVELPFTLAEYRNWFAEQLGGTFDGVRQCRYCGTWLSWSIAVPDHREPVARGGSWALTNLDLVCAPCNHRKGQMSAEGFLALERFLNELAEGDRKDVRRRLEMAVQLAAGQRWGQRQPQPDRGATDDAF